MIDISLPLKKGMITYPGNPRFSRTAQKTKTSEISKLALGTHTGTHIDAPKHVFKNGLCIDAYNLNVFNGAARVIDCTSSKTAVTAEDIHKHRIQKGERILIKTQNSKRGFKIFYKTYVYLSGEASEYLAKRGVTLVGMDFISVKQPGSADNTPHTNLLEKNIPILEGIDLHAVSEGQYILLCAPLRIEGADGAPARAGLLPIRDMQNLKK